MSTTTQAPPAAPSRVRARVLLAIRAAVSLTILILLARRVDLSAVVPRWTPRTIGGLAAAAATLLAGHAVAAARWREVLLALDSAASYPSLLLYTLAGNFVGNFLPTAVAGDVVRVTRAGNDIASTETAFASTVIDRLSGWLVLPLMGIVGLVITPALRRDGHVRSLSIALCLVSLAGLCVVLALAGSRRLGGKLHGRDGWTRFLGAVHFGIDKIRMHPLRGAKVLTFATAYQLVMVSGVWVASWALDLGVSPWAMLGVAPLVFIAQTLPLSIGGLGIREGAYSVLLAPLGVAKADAVGLGLALYALTILTSLIGAPAFATPPASSTATRG